MRRTGSGPELKRALSGLDYKRGPSEHPNLRKATSGHELGSIFPMNGGGRTDFDMKSELSRSFFERGRPSTSF